MGRLRGQAERAQELVDELTGGSSTVTDELRALAAQVRDRATLYGWSEAADWARVLDQRLSADKPMSGDCQDDVEWLRGHVATFLEIAGGGESAQPIESSSAVIVAKTGASPAPAAAEEKPTT